jgi:hypothetical protein
MRLVKRLHADRDARAAAAALRKLVVQVPLDPADAELLIMAATNLGRARGEVARALIKGDMTWNAVVRAGRDRKPTRAAE